jgi:hypothetical protein
LIHSTSDNEVKRISGIAQKGLWLFLIDPPVIVVGKSYKDDSVELHSIMATYLPAAYRHFAPVGGCLYKKLLELFFPFANISLKYN